MKLTITIGAHAEKGIHNRNPHPYIRNNFKGTKEVQEIRKERGILMSWDNKKL